MADITPDWFHLMPYGYAPGSYQNRCMHCTNVVAELDKRAVSCRPCAAKVHEIDRLRKEVDAHAAKDTEIAQLRQYLDAAQRRGEELSAQVAALEGDAGRYRWLRDKLDVSDQAAWNIFMSEGVDQWDAAIDAARKGEA